MELLELRPSDVVADLGCGSGYFAVPVSRKVMKVYGVDVQEEMLELLGRITDAVLPRCSDFPVPVRVLPQLHRLLWDNERMR